ncbi:PucR family transcriptional regulator ligand-binding domain-containing protein [Paenarthrobacter sp. OM7]|uniref:PucR family transcriptional regulator n=1 Tax=Paenarthrobacter sp. OM7 TaxID=3041264 RepID=UPI002468CDD9|nr:PucR family transcriptional regulator [Paenarthrobacter sp. OM7]WGM20363.1 PucR family transcriptional regulator ligand-binding domain-containing protein [Paenarthrobacter sp. OM7]
MAITVAELVAEPQLGLTLLAGPAGTDNRITWAHTSDLPRLWEWVTGGELMMTNGLSIPADADGQVALAEALMDSGASALAIGEKMHAPPLTPEFLDACDKLPLPLINIPYPLPFIAIARSVAESSLLEESRRLRQTARVYDLLRTAGASEDHWQSLVQRLATELDADLFVVDRRCLHPWHPDGQALPAFLAEEWAPLSGHVSLAGKNFQWHRIRGRHVLTMDIPTHANALLVVLPHNEPHPDAVVLLHAATVLGLQLSRIVLSLEGRHRLAGEFLLQAMDGRLGAAEMESRLAGFDVPPQGLLLASMTADGATADDGGRLANVHIELWRHGVASASLKRNNRLHVVVSADVPDSVLVHCAGEDAAIGISAPAAVASIQRALQESLWALGSARANGLGLARYAEGPSWLGLTSFEEGTALVRRLLGPIFDYEQGQEGDLILTLRTYLDSQRSWQKTATALFAHRQTIIYRMRKIGELTGLDMGETSTVAQLWFALQIHEAMHQ